MRTLTLLLGLAAVAAPLSGCTALAVTSAATGVLIAEDRRTTGTYILDEEIELKAASRVREQKLEGVHANFTSFNRRLLITGEVPTEAVKAQVGAVSQGVPNVREVINELAIATPTGFASRSNDGYLTAKVKTRFLDDERFNVHHVKVVTENNVVYLMGLVKRDEGTAAAEVAARTSGVTRVIKIFEYLD